VPSRARSISVRVTRRKAGAAAAAIAAALAFGGCGDGASGGSDDEERGADPVGQELGGSVAALVQCSDWDGATEAQKLATIEDVRSQVNREDAGVTSSELTDAEAMEVFDTGCAKPYAGGFRLHVMYARAAAFKPLRDVAEGRVEAPSE
jgi:hypothetical protein